MAHTSEGTEFGLPALGATVRLLRKRQGLSLEALSQRADVSFGALSQLERGMGNPSFVTLSKLAGALGVALTELMQSSARGDQLVVRAGERRVLPEEGGTSPQARRELLTPGLHTPLQVIRTTLPAGFSNEGNAFRHLGMECVVVESGRLRVVHGERVVELEPGDAMTYACSTAHWWANAADGETVVLGAVTPLEA
ncbi:XRE family transcriptional regulator [Arthrobacter sp.]|uniref:helix-turn-helix domain-containing protein n=1 Tax=Arthrobacter sp. TaxID=1667 RepID=UPI0028A1BA18|nr:XRE family transcriptional regulator [Arthrobacter sp.]